MAGYSGDANFPQKLAAASQYEQLTMLQNLYTRYSRTVFTRAVDRPAGIHSIEKRLSRALGESMTWGLCFHDEMLLALLFCWVRAADEVSVAPIASVGVYPSWS